MIHLSDFQKKIIRSILVLLLFEFSIYWQYIPVLFFKLDTKNLSMAIKVLLSAFSSFITFFIFFFIYRKELKKEFNIFKKNLMENLDVGFRYWIVGLVIMVISNTIISKGLNAAPAQNEQIVQQMIKALPIIMAIDAGILAPFTEEIVYRKAVRDVFGNNKWLFASIAFLLFGGAHVVGVASIWTDYLYIIPYGAFGAAFALAYHKTDTFFTPLYMHMMHNIILVTISIIL